MSRIELLASLNKDANSLVDVGCDHGYVAIKAIKEYNAKYAYLLDVNQLPLESAKKNVSHEGLLDQTDFLLSDGLIKYEGPTDNLVIAGMGGMLITKILSDSLFKAKCFKKVILEANNEVDKLRGFLINNHFVFDDEFIIKDGKRVYEIIVCHYDDSNNAKYSKLDMKFGPILRRKHPELFMEVISRKKKLLEDCLMKVNDEVGKSKIKIELSLIQLLLGEINGK